MSKLDDVRALFRSGAIVECVENTYIPANAGQKQRIIRAGRSVSDVRVLTGRNAGKPFRHNLPTRVSDVVSVSADRATWRIGRDDHTVTYRVITDHEHCAEMGECWQDREPCPALAR